MPDVLSLVVNSTVENQSPDQLEVAQGEGFPFSPIIHTAFFLPPIFNFKIFWPTSSSFNIDSADQVMLLHFFKNLITFFSDWAIRARLISRSKLAEGKRENHLHAADFFKEPSPIFWPIFLQRFSLAQRFFLYRDNVAKQSQIFIIFVHFTTHITFKHCTNLKYYQNQSWSVTNQMSGGATICIYRFMCKYKKTLLIFSLNCH